jgi:hypothetical protein
VTTECATKSDLSDEDIDAINEMVWSGWSRAAAERKVRARIKYENSMVKPTDQISEASNP